ncbi:MAG: phosphoadenosine phosphosulfate reductase family protein [Candidatus Delongbacteria bacterium]|nr:phosphoadenosine phosphosulfate reductase family protein [Candidatus Delongbacteria bacterium]
MTSNNIVKIVLFSGGIASFEVGRLVLEKYAKENIRFWFFDTLTEDDSLYNFVDQCEDFLGIEIERFCDGRNIWEVFRDERFIGNSRVPLCNRVLKRELLERKLKQEFPSKNLILFLGYEYYEKERMEKAKNKWNKNGYQVSFPLAEKEHQEKEVLISKLNDYGLTIPKLYDLGFKHNNCGGACVRAGINQWLLLLELFPERYLWHERQEQQIREYLNKDVAILRDRTGGVTKPLTLRELRLRRNGK